MRHSYFRPSDIGSHFESLVRNLVASGRYPTASEVIRDGLRLIEEREDQRHAKLQALREAIREGMESGPAEPLKLEEIISEAKARRRAAQR